MILYNVTVNVDLDIHDEWLNWMKTKHVPDVMATGCFVQNFIYHIVNPIPESGESYSFQYLCNDVSDLENYIQNYAPALKAEVIERYGEKFVAFRTVMQSV